jgi:hypothetical protein
VEGQPVLGADLNCSESSGHGRPALGDRRSAYDRCGRDPTYGYLVVACAEAPRPVSRPATPRCPRRQLTREPQAGNEPAEETDAGEGE